jgi:hypothetical protein
VADALEHLPAFGLELGALAVANDVGREQHEERIRRGDPCAWPAHLESTAPERTLSPARAAACYARSYRRTRRWAWNIGPAHGHG